MRKRTKAAILTMVAVMSLWTGVQFIGVLGKKPAPANALVMLYEASLFQVELLSGFISDAAEASTTEQLNGLKQAAYSMEYTHKKLLQASGGELPSLHSVSSLMEWIVRLQMGGSRKMKEQETQLFAELAPHFQELHEGYAAVMNTTGEINRTSAERLREADERMTVLLKAVIQ